MDKIIRKVIYHQKENMTQKMMMISGILQIPRKSTKTVTYSKAAGLVLGAFGWPKILEQMKP
jgi:hypothetical protein